MKPITTAEARAMTWQALEGVKVTVQDSREPKPLETIFSSIQAIKGDTIEARLERLRIPESEE